ncbi:MAG: YARHG domain-containing protein [Muribaculaceae bacterium]|nr:YARHG domain-containing protein [Muribaculaceae bacterium]
MQNQYPQPPRPARSSNSVMITVIICATVVVLAVLISIFVFFINKKESPQANAVPATETVAQNSPQTLNVPEGGVAPAKKHSTGSLKDVGWTNDYSDIVCYNYLDESDVYNLSKSQLRILRNTIYARHGRRFASRDLREYFSRFNWYNPRYDEISPSSLSAIEKHNIALIQRYE